MPFRVLAAAVLLAAPVASHAVELIFKGDVAGGGSLAGFTASAHVNAITGASYVATAGGNGSAAAQANIFVSFGAGNTGGVETLSQSVATAAGRGYRLSFDYGSFGGDQAIELFVGGASIVTLSPVGTLNLDALFTPASYTFTGNGALVEIMFQVVTLEGDNRDAFVDNISVTAVPEPTSWALMIAGFAMVGFARRRIALAA